MESERELLLLGMLRFQAMHGYQLHELISSHLGGGIRIKRPTTYSLLSRMTDAGWVSYQEEQAGNRPLRRVYTLTDAGEETFQTLVRQGLADNTPTDYPGSVALAFMDAVPPSETIGLLRQRRASVEHLLHATRSQDEHGGSMQLVIENQIRHISVELEWLDEVIERLGDREANGGQSVE